MIEQKLPLRIEVSGILKARSYRFDVLAHTDVDQLGIPQDRCRTSSGEWKIKA